jgi:hypothetical protein
MPSPSTRIRVREVPTRHPPSQRRYPPDTQHDWLEESPALSHPPTTHKRYISPEKPKTNRRLLIIGLVVFLHAIFFFFFRDLMPVQILRDYMDIYGPVVAGIGAFLIIRSMPRKMKMRKKNNHKMQFRR